MLCVHSVTKRRKIFVICSGNARFLFSFGEFKNYFMKDVTLTKSDVFLGTKNLNICNFIFLGKKCIYKFRAEELFHNFIYSIII